MIQGFFSIFMVSKICEFFQIVGKFCSNFTLRKQKLPIDFVGPVQKLTAKVFTYATQIYSIEW
jgi:hypothetical protein